ncbi:hypothetical protein Tco_0357075 [Tanacetum coccineum]
MITRLFRDDGCHRWETRIYAISAKMCARKESLFLDNISGMIKAIEGVRKIIAGPATWMLEFSSQVVEARLELASRAEPTDQA